MNLRSLSQMPQIGRLSSHIGSLEFLAVQQQQFTIGSWRIIRSLKHVIGNICVPISNSFALKIMTKPPRRCLEMVPEGLSGCAVGHGFMDGTALGLGRSSDSERFRFRAARPRRRSEGCTSASLPWCAPPTMGKQASWRGGWATLTDRDS